MEKQDGVHACHLEIPFPDSNSKMICLINLKCNRVIGHHHGLIAFEIEVPSFAHFGHPKIFWFLDSNSKMLCPINLNLNRVIGHHKGLVSFEIRVVPFPHFGLVFIRNISVSGL